MNLAPRVQKHDFPTLFAKRHSSVLAITGSCIMTCGFPGDVCLTYSVSNPCAGFGTPARLDGGLDNGHCLCAHLHCSHYNHDDTVCSV